MNSEVLVKNILSLPSLEGAYIVAGKSYADNLITNLAVMEVPDISDWVRPGEFLITTGYMFKDNPEEFVNIIPELRYKDVAALGIKPNRFLNNIPNSIINAANEYGLPLIYLPPHTNFSKVTSEVMERILIKDINIEDFLIHNTIRPTQYSLDEIKEYFRALGITIDMNSNIRLLAIPMSEDFLFSSLKQTFNSLFINTKIKILTTRRDNLMGLLCIYNNEDDWIRFKENNETYMEQIVSNYNVNLFIGNPQKGFTNNSKLYEDLISLMDLFSSSSKKLTLVTWDKVGIQTIIPSIYESPYHRYLYNTYLNPIKNYDQKKKGSLYETLKEYLNCNGNMKIAAQNLYIHYNTICYRINIIKDEFNWNLSNTSTLTDLNLAFLLDAYISRKN